MNVGMLWFDGDRKRELCVKVERAAAYYRGKYGRVPNVCIVHPVTAGGEPPSEVGGLKLRTSKAVLPDHFWLGLDRRVVTGGSAARN